jgi:uncharacterized membrane protein
LTETATAPIVTSGRKESGKSRLAFLDWTRGVAAIIMLQGHVFHSFTRPDLRESGLYVGSQFVGGMPPAIFLFLVGVTLAFLMDGRERQGLPALARIWAAARRSGYLFGIAILFRLQLWLFGLPASPWQDLLKVDILNAMGLAVLLLSVMAVFRTADRVRACAALGLAIAAVSPLVSQIDWSVLPAPLGSYFAPDYNSFGFFPWAAFAAFGLSAGSIIRMAGSDHLERIMQWSALMGFGLVLGGMYFSEFPYSVYPKSEFWLDSPWLIFIKLGVILLMLSFAYLWSRQPAARKWSWVRQFGITSLLVYWVHIELIYGRWFWFWKESLTLAQTCIAAVGLILLMLLLSRASTDWRNWRLPSLAPAWGLMWIRKFD